MNYIKYLSSECPKSNECVLFNRPLSSNYDKVDVYSEIIDKEDEECSFFIDNDEYFDDDIFLAD